MRISHSTLFVMVGIGSTLLAMLIHELGHLVAARRCGVAITELSLGFGPVLCGFRVGGVNYNLRLLPLGSFVRLSSNEMHRRPLPQQLFFHLAGIGFNLFAALATMGTIFCWANLLLAAANLLPLYQHDGWKCGVALTRALLGYKSRPVEWAFTFSGGMFSVALVQAALYIIG